VKSNPFITHHSKGESIYMNDKSILIVDDERNIRLTLSQCLESPDVRIDTAKSGEEALVKLKEREFRVVLLDLRLPGMDGMEVLRKVHELRPDIRIVIITAHGTIDSAVEATRLGAVDFIMKPFVPQEIRNLVSRVMDKEKASERRGDDYVEAIDLAGKCIEARRLDAATEPLRRAIYIDHDRPEAFNLMGAVLELKRDIDEARRHYRAAYWLDPTYEPAMKNLDRITSWHKTGSILLGEPKAQSKPPEESRTIDEE
jgi:FixJ family two-component response regulator